MKSQVPESLQKALCQGYHFVSGESFFNDQNPDYGDFTEDGKLVTEGWICLERGNKGIAVPTIAVRLFGKPIATSEGTGASPTEKEEESMVYPEVSTSLARQ